MIRAVLVVALLGCGSAKSPPATWPVPEGWKEETIPFPLGFAPTIAHRGVEELRFPPGFLKQEDPHAWAYTFVWRLEDRAELDEAQLAGELTAYFRGLMVEGRRRQAANRSGADHDGRDARAGAVRDPRARAGCVSRRRAGGARGMGAAHGVWHRLAVDVRARAARIGGARGGRCAGGAGALPLTVSSRRPSRRQRCDGTSRSGRPRRPRRRLA